MKNQGLLRLKSKVKLNIQGKNIERFIKRLKTNHIDILKIEYIRYNEVNILIYMKDEQKVFELKTTYDVLEQNIYGIIKLKKVISKYRYIVFSFILCLLGLFFLSNVIFKVDVIHNDSNIRSLLLQELESYGISKYHLKKNYSYIQNIKTQILDKYKNTLEWLEIESQGTTYIVRVEERIIPDLEEQYDKQNVIAKKGAILKKIVASSGQIIREINSYVNPGDVVISGNIMMNEEVKDKIRADGKIYGEVWYNVQVEYPYVYSEIKETGNTQEKYVFKVFHKDYHFGKSYEEKRVEETILLGHPFLPFSFLKQKQREVKIISSILTEEQAITEAISKAKKKIEEQLQEDEHVITYQVLKTSIEEDKVIVNVFFTVYENITAYEAIEEGEGNVP